MVDQSVPGPGVRIKLDHSLYKSCDCDVTCQKKKTDCPCMKNCSYDECGRLSLDLMSETTRPIFECNSNCTCTIDCLNRVTQKKGAELDDMVKVKEASGKGAGLFAKREIPQGTYIGEYVGEIIRVSTAKERLQSLSLHDSCYIVQFREHDQGSGVTMTTCIDARLYGNHTRFINHSCSPNLVMMAVRRDSIVPSLCLFVCVPVINVGEELCFSYCEGSEESEASLGKKPCLCGSSNCRKYMPLQT